MCWCKPFFAALGFIGLFWALSLAIAGPGNDGGQPMPESKQSSEQVNWKEKDDAYWRSVLTPEQYRIARQGGTEPPGTGKYYHSKEKGMYVCSSCGLDLFDSDTKYDSGSGWPSFYAPVSESNVELRSDNSHGMRRTEVVCPRCGAHLGHVFDDGPNPTGKRFCINSASLDLKAEGEGTKK